MEKFGLGPRDIEPLNAGLIYARLSGYGQYGPMSSEAGHDINYLALSGVLSKLGRYGEKPYAPINLLADFAGGGLVCALGIIMALYERVTSGQGQVIDCSMVEGAAYVSTWLWRSSQLFTWGNERGKNWLDGGAPFYDTYKTKDGKYITVGTIEPEFFDNFIKAIGLSSEDVEWSQFESNGSGNSVLRDRLTTIFLNKSRDEWCQILKGLDVCVAPVLDMSEVAQHPHHKVRGTFMMASEPEPAPRLSRTPARVTRYREPGVGEHTEEILREMQVYSDEEIRALIDTGVMEQGEHGLTQTRLEKQWAKL